MHRLHATGVESQAGHYILHTVYNISSGEVKAMYAAGPEHKSESTELILMHWNDFAKRVIEEDAINMPG